MRPASYREQEPEQGCFNCRHGLCPEHKDHLLCFNGDRIIVGKAIREDENEIILEGRSVGLLDGYDYDQVWGGRVVEPTGICDEWKSKT